MRWDGLDWIRLRLSESYLSGLVMYVEGTELANFSWQQESSFRFHVPVEAVI